MVVRMKRFKYGLNKNEKLYYTVPLYWVWKRYFGFVGKEDTVIAEVTASRKIIRLYSLELYRRWINIKNEYVDPDIELRETFNEILDLI